MEFWQDRRKDHWTPQVAKFREHFIRVPDLLTRSPILCLGARWGEECAALADLGALAIGVDLNPDADNRWVVSGDFHQLQFPEASFGAAYTNVIDHVLEIDTFIAQVHRVLKPRSSIWLLDIYRGFSETGRLDSWGALFYDTAQTVLNRILSDGRFEFDRGVRSLGRNYLSVVLRKV